MSISARPNAFRINFRRSKVEDVPDYTFSEVSCKRCHLMTNQICKEDFCSPLILQLVIRIERYESFKITNSRQVFNRYMHEFKHVKSFI